MHCSLRRGSVQLSSNVFILREFKKGERHMPIYEYRCKKCESVQEELQAVGATDEGLTCKKCGSDSLTKVLSVIARVPGSDSDGDDDFGCGADSCPSGGCCQGCDDWD